MPHPVVPDVAMTAEEALANRLVDALEAMTDADMAEVYEIAKEVIRQFETDYCID